VTISSLISQLLAPPPRPAALSRGYAFIGTFPRQLPSGGQREKCAGKHKTPPDAFQSLLTITPTPDSIGSFMPYRNSPTRREILKGLSALGAGALLLEKSAAPQSSPPTPRVIDCHHHFVSPAFLKTLTAKQGHKVEGFTSFFPLGLWKDYSPAKDIEMMDRDGVATSLISCTAPGVWFGDPDEARTLARELNEYGAKMASDYKGRYGLLAVLPIPRVEESLKEIEYAFDTLHASGVGILTSYGNKWLGDPAFQPIFDELNRRKAVVYTHPIDAPCCQDLMPGVNPTTLEYPTDTTRAILSLLGTNAASPATRYGDIKFIFSHAGGTMPSVIDRIGVGNPDTIAANLRGTPEANSRLYHLRRFYYDTAQSTNTVQLQALKTIAGVSQIVFGTDYPFGATAAKQVQGLQECGFNPDELQSVQMGNALRLFPKVKG
jgi:predicted TIM-barrel fold metal-dependent hydrolase